MSEIETMTTFFKQVVESAQHVVESMNDGDRMQVKQLAEVVGLHLAKDPKEVMGFVNHFIHNTSLAYVTRGKNGGLVRGLKSAKVVKPAKAKKTSDNS